MAVYIVLSATLLTNLIWVKRFHQGVAALDPHSAAVMGISLLNVAAFAIASFWGAVASTPAGTLSKRWPSAVRWFFGSRKPALDEATAGSAAEGRGEATRKVRRKSARRRH